MKLFLLCINSHIVDIVSVVWLGHFDGVDGFGHIQSFYGLGGTGYVLSSYIKIPADSKILRSFCR